MLIYRYSLDFRTAQLYRKDELYEEVQPLGIARQNQSLRLYAGETCRSNRHQPIHPELQAERPIVFLHQGDGLHLQRTGHLYWRYREIFFCPLSLDFQTERSATYDT